ncbi:MAG: archaellin/type IV pilin N-terminal domain-containing protein [Acidilobaceae archaeon]
MARRGIVGIESAIVLIAFVIVAAALAFVVLNMGFFTSQQSKLVMQRGLGEASSALELDGTFVAAVNTTEQNIVYAWAPVKLSSGQHKVDLTPTKTIVSYWSPDKGLTITNAYLIAILTPITNTSKIPEIVNDVLDETVSGAKGTVTRSDINGYAVYVGLPEDVNAPGIRVSELLERYASGKVIVILNWVVRVNDDLVLDPGEKVVFFIYYRDPSVRPDGYDLVKIEVKVPIGAPLTIERMIPPSLTQPVVDLG